MRRNHCRKGKTVLATKSILCYIYSAVPKGSSAPSWFCSRMIDFYADSVFSRHTSYVITATANWASKTVPRKQVLVYITASLTVEQMLFIKCWVRKKGGVSISTTKARKCPSSKWILKKKKNAFYQLDFRYHFPPTYHFNFKSKTIKLKTTKHWELQ